MEKRYQGFEGLEVCKAAKAFRQKSSILAKSFPKSEEYLLKSQIIRSSRSIPATTSEVYGRFHYQELIQFCRRARGSLNEAFEHLLCAYKEQYIPEAQLKDLREDVQNLLGLVNAFTSDFQKQNAQAKQALQNAWGAFLTTTHTTNTTI